MIQNIVTGKAAHAIMVIAAWAQMDDPNKSLVVGVFIFSWNEFPFALTLTAKATATVPVAIAKFAQEFEIQYTQMAAGAVLSVLPALLLLVVGQRAIVRGLTAGALK